MKLFSPTVYVGDAVDSVMTMGGQVGGVAGELGPAAVRRLYDELAEPLRGALARLAPPGADADDLLHEVFVVALRRSEQLLSASSPRAWLFGVAVKIASRARSRHRLRRFFGLDESREAADMGRGPHDALVRREEQALVRTVLGGMSDKRREALVLYELEGLSGAEIAEALHIPLKTVWTRLHHARKDFEQAVSREAPP